METPLIWGDLYDSIKGHVSMSLRGMSVQHVALARDTAEVYSLENSVEN